MAPHTNRPVEGRHIHLIRWVSTPEGWTSQVLRGRLLRGDDDAWVLQSADGVHRLPRAEWQRFVPDAPPIRADRRAAHRIPEVPTTAKPVIGG